MKKTLIIMVVVLAFALISCVKNLDNYGFAQQTTLKGRVIEKSQNQPIKGVTVSVTDGSHVHTSQVTGDDGRFEFRVDFDAIDESYSLQLDCQGYTSTKEDLKGFGQESYDYQDIVYYDNSNPSNWPNITTNDVFDVTSTTARTGGTITYSGAAAITARGVCWGTTHSPNIDGNHTTDGEGTGSFSSNLTNLSVNTTYFVRAYAKNMHGIYYGNEVSFITTNGLPEVTTTAPTKTGTRVTTGGNITSDGGYAIIARGVCYSLTPYPDLSSAHHHTTNGSGTGSYSSTFTMSGTGVYYIRAYATNANGTVYGEQKTIGHPYNDLPTFTFGGRTYRVAPPADNTKDWTNANSYCNNLTLYGYSDWRLPTKDELLQMYYDRFTIGGFNTNDWWSGTSAGSSTHYEVYFYNGYVYGEYDYHLFYVRPIRVEN